MSDYFFGLGKGKVTADAARRAQTIADQHGATFVNPTIPGDGPRYWFACRNRGEPFDRRTAIAVKVALAADGLDIHFLPRESD